MPPAEKPEGNILRIDSGVTDTSHRDFFMHVILLLYGLEVCWFALSYSSK